MLNEIFSAVLQILVFTLIPFLVYLISRRSTVGFLNYIGLKASNRRANILAVGLSLLLGLPLLLLTFFYPDFREIMTDPESVTGKIRALGFSAQTIAIIILIAVFKTALSEEILFRGFLAKRLISLTGYQTGNILQAVIFGIIHSLLFLKISSNILFLAAIFVFPAISAYLMVYLNEKVANGSIIPGWIMHGLGNIIAYSMVAFLI